MLVLTRKPEEMIQIGDNIVIKVLQVRRNTVKIGIEAPADVLVMRSEVNDKRIDASPLPAGTTLSRLAERLRMHHAHSLREQDSLPHLAVNV